MFIREFDKVVTDCLLSLNSHILFSHFEYVNNYLEKNNTNLNLKATMKFESGSLLQVQNILIRTHVRYSYANMYLSVQAIMQMLIEYFPYVYLIVERKKQVVSGEN